MTADGPRRRSSARALAALALAAASAAAAPEPSAAAPSLRADPATLTLGTGARASLVLDGAGKAAPTITVNVGKIERVRAAGPGRFVADYVAPAAGHPQVAIVCAVLADGVAWTAIPLSGRGVAVAHTDPKARLTVTIAGKPFGPVRADASGEARVPVVVPAGVALAYHGEEALDLHVPATLHLHALADRSAVRADQEEEIVLVLLAVSPDGAPRADAPVQIDVSHGAIEAIDAAGRGSYRARWRLPAGPAAEATAIARLDDEPGPVAVVRIARPAGPAARLAVEPGPEAAVAGGEPVAVKLRVSDAAGNAVDAAPAVTASFGALDAPERIGPGEWIARLRVPSRLEGHLDAEVVARAGDAEGRVKVSLAGAPAERLVVTAPETPLLADGASEARISVAAFDRFGNAVAGEPPGVEATLAAKVSSEPDGAGGHVVRYRPSRARSAATEVLSIRAGPLVGEARLELVAPVRRLELVPKLGLAFSTGGLRSPVLAAEAAWWLDRLDGRLGVLAEVATLRVERTDDLAVSAASVSVRGSARYVPILLSAAWREPFAERWRAWGAAGAGPAYVSSDVGVAGDPSLSEAGWTAAAHLSAGLARTLGPGLPFAEARLTFCADPGLESFRGTLTSFSLSLGYRYDAF